MTADQFAAKLAKCAASFYRIEQSTLWSDSSDWAVKTARQAVCRYLQTMGWSSQRIADFFNIPKASAAKQASLGRANMARGLREDLDEVGLTYLQKHFSDTDRLTELEQTVTTLQTELEDLKRRVA